MFVVQGTEEDRFQFEPVLIGNHLKTLVFWLSSSLGPAKFSTLRYTAEDDEGEEGKTGLCIWVDAHLTQVGGSLWVGAASLCFNRLRDFYHAGFQRVIGKLLVWGVPLEIALGRPLNRR